jgi:hypothetical protein
MWLARLLGLVLVLLVFVLCFGTWVEYLHSKDK